MQRLVTLTGWGRTDIRIVSVIEGYTILKAWYFIIRREKLADSLVSIQPFSAPELAPLVFCGIIPVSRSGLESDLILLY